MPQPPQNPALYARDGKKLYCKGIDLNSPIDSVKDLHYPILENLRSYTDGVIRPRQGLTAINTGITSQTPLHSIRRLNNTLNSTYTRLIGAGTKLATGQTAFTNVQYNAVDVAFSGKPLAMVPWRPDQSPVSWMYVADSSAMYKVAYDGSTVSTHKVGITPPVNPPTVELATPKLGGWGPPFTVGSIFTAASVGSWTNVPGIAGAVANANRFSGITTTAVMYDSGTSGWCSIVPSAGTNMGPGTVLYTLTGLNAENVMIWEMYRAASTASNSVSQIIYDNRPTNTGACTIVATGSVQELQRNAVVLLNGAKYARITEVIPGPDQTMVAFKCNTGATTISAGQTLAVVTSFRTYTIGTFDLTTTYQADTLQSLFTPAGASLTGNLTYTPASPIDMTFAISGTSTITDLDYIHLAFKCADLAQLSQLRIMFDVDDGSFTKNFYYRAVTPSDLVAAAKGTQTILASTAVTVGNKIITRPTYRARARRDLNPPRIAVVDSTGSSSDFSTATFNDEPNLPNEDSGSPRDQTGTGDSQWSEIRFRRGDCIRVGTDWSKGWQAVAKFRIEGTMISGGAATLLEFSSLNVFGGSTPDIGDIGFPYLYRYRYRASTTGVASNWSPATRSGILALRVDTNVTPGSTSAQPEADLIDFQRWGGLVDQWADVGTKTIFSPILRDITSDDAASARVPDSVDNVNFQPWVSSQTPKSGTASIVAGTMVLDNATNFSTAWLPGTGIKVNGNHTTIRRVISTSLLEVEDCVGSSTNLSWEVPEPFIQISLPTLWGGGEVNGWFFACGDTTNPGRLYFSNQNNPDATGGSLQGQQWLDVTAPSEPLQNGFVYNGRNYVFSSEKLYEIVEVGQGQFLARPTPTGKGLMYRWAFCVGQRIWFLAKDGIYETDGGIARSITFDTLFPFFPKEGTLGTSVNGFYPPNMTTGNITVSGITADVSTFFRMAFYDSYIYFIYPDTNNRMRCLTYLTGNFAFVQESNAQAGWFPDVFNPGGGNTGIMCVYGEEGNGVHNLLMGGAEATTAKLYSYGGTADDATAIPWHFRQPCLDAGDKRPDKLWADFVVSADAGGGTINVAAGINEYSSTPAINNPATGAATITGSGRVKATFDIASGAGVEARNIAVDLSGTGTTASLYFIEHAFAARPEDSFKRFTQYEDCGYQGEKWFQGIEIEADTYNVAKTAEVRYDSNVLADTLALTHNGRVTKAYSFSSGFVAHMARLAPTDSLLWKLYKWRWVWEPEPPLVTVWHTQPTSHGHVGFIHLKSIWITHTSTADLTLTIKRMDDNTTRSFTIPNSGGVRAKETYIILGPAEFCKGKTFEYKITQATNTPFRIYQKNCGVMVKNWASGQAFTRWMGWGADSGDGAAQI